MPLKLSLKPGEKFVCNGAVLTNGERRVSLVIENKASILRDRDIMQADQATTPAADTGEARRKLRVLVVDDDPDIAYLLEVLLGELGFRVSIVGDATAAVERALSDVPDILLVDVELPGLSGNTAVFRLRSQGYKGHIVTLSATPTEEARKVALNAGADQYLTKPINIDEFSRVMRRAAQTD